MENFALNHQLLLWFYAGAHPLTWQIYLGTFAAKYLCYLFPLVLVYQCLRYRNQWALVIVIFIALLVSIAASQLIQHFYFANRPFADGLVINLIQHSPNSSFPSDHTLFASTIAFGFVFARLYKVGFFLVVMALIVGWGRIYMGLHYPLDVLGGFFLGMLSAFVCIKGFLASFQKALL